MAIIKSCCCGWTLRTGCYVSAMFSLTYFFLFTWITGSMTFGRIQVLFFSPDEMYENDDMDAGSTYYAKDDNSNNMQTEKNIGEQQQLQHVTGRISSVTSVPSSLSHSKGNESGDEDNNIKRISNVSSMMLDPNLLLENDGGTTELSTMRLFLGSDTYSIVQTVNLVMDLLCEVAGVYASILLIRGLQKERKRLFWPWMIVVPTHIAIDAITISGIVMEYLLEPMGPPLSLVLLTVSLDVTLNSINAYGLICVISQYQEYKAGRGTAAYVEFTSSQTPTIMLETTSTTKTVLNQSTSFSGHNNRRRSSQKEFSSTRYNNEKSDTYCEEFSLQTVNHSNDENQSLSDGTHLNNKGARNGKVHNKVRNGQVMLIIPNEKSQIPYNNGILIEEDVTSSVCDSDNNKLQGSVVVVEAQNNRENFGQFLDVQHRRTSSTKGILKHTKANPINLVANDDRDRDESSGSDSESEAVTVDVLTAFGISSHG